MKTKKLYVVYKLASGEICTDTINLSGKVNQLTVAQEIYHHMNYYNREWPVVLSWQVEDAFTFEEEQEFWKNH